jgi:protein phosphatase
MIEYEHAALSDQGPIRENNEDFLAHFSPTDPETSLRKGCIFVVADGVGGNRAGEVASLTASQKLIEAYYAASRMPSKAIRDAFAQANLAVIDLGHTKPEYRKMETTLSAIGLVGKHLHIGHIGDSRIYRVRSNEIQQLTTDHSEVGELVRMRLITAEEARHHPRRNVITRSIGSDLLVQVDFRSDPLEVGDIFVLCTDGLWEPVEDDEITEIVTQNSAEAACRLLIDLALERGTADNVSIQVIKVLKLSENSLDTSERKNGLLRRLFR